MPADGRPARALERGAPEAGNEPGRPLISRATVRKLLGKRAFN